MFGLNLTNPRHFKTPPWRAMVGVFVNALELKHPYTRGHSQRVQNLVRAMIPRLRKRQPKLWNEYHSQCLSIGALNHDIGKLLIDEAILNNRDSLTPEEIKKIQLHPEHGAKLLADIFPQEVLDGIKYHHERWNTTGYPKGFGGEAIPLIARLIAICDAFDAMTTERTYNLGKVMTISAAANRILELAGTHFDPVNAKIFVEEVVPHL